MTSPLPRNRSTKHTFPFDLFEQPEFPGSIGEHMAQVRNISMIPPYPWGHWLYGHVLKKHCAGLPGEVIEAGAGRGGMSIFLGLVLRDLGVDKTVFAVDSYVGLPPPSTKKDNPYFQEGQYGLDAGEDQEALFRSVWLRAALHGLESKVVPVAGFFEDILPELVRGRQFCFVHIDADLFDSVACALDNLYDTVVPGGVIAIDDFFHPAQGPLRAAAEFFNERGVSPLYHIAFPYGVFVFKDDEDLPRARSVDGNSYSLEWLRGDALFLAALERSLERSAGDERADANCRLLLEMLRSPTQNSDIYDYWRALEAFWEAADTTDTTKGGPERIEPHPPAGGPA